MQSGFHVLTPIHAGMFPLAVVFFKLKCNEPNYAETFFLSWFQRNFNMYSDPFNKRTTKKKNDQNVDLRADSEKLPVSFRYARIKTIRLVLLDPNQREGKRFTRRSQTLTP